MLPQNLESEQLFSNTIEQFFDNYQVSELISRHFPAKRSGVQPEEIIKYLLDLKISSQTIYSNRNSDFLEAPCDENTVYRFLNNPENDWEGFLSGLSSRIAQTGPSLLPGGVFIVDDTDRPRYNGLKVELNSWQFDHAGLCRHRHYRGFKELTLGYMADGVYLAAGLVLSSSNNHLINGSFIDVPSESPGGRRRRLSGLSKNEAMFDMVRSAQAEGLRAKYLLADSWFTEPKTAFQALDLGFEYIGMVKQEGRTRYLFQGKMMTVHQIFDYYKKKCEEYGQEGSVFLDVPVKMFSGGRERDVRLLYFDNIHEDKPYCCFLVTDLMLSALTVQTIYKARFSCEESYKSLKDTDTVRTLKSCQSLSFDANLAQACLDLVVYNILADMDKRSGGEKSIKTVFRESRESVQIAKWLNLVNELLKAVLAVVSEELKQSLGHLTFIVRRFLTDYDPLTQEINRLSRFENLDPASLMEKLIIKGQL